MIWILLIILILVLAYYLVPTAYIGLGLYLLEKYRNYLGKKKLILIENFFKKIIKKKLVSQKAVDEFFRKHKDEVVATEGNIELINSFSKPHPLITSHFSENRIWIYKMDRLFKKYMDRSFERKAKKLGLKREDLEKLEKQVEMNSK